MEGRNYIYDAETVLEDGAAAKTESGAGQVSSAAKIYDFGYGVLTRGKLVIDVSAIKISANDELYDIGLQVSDVSDFSTGSPVIEEVVSIKLGANEVLPGNVDSVVGRYVLDFANIKLNTKYQYGRLYATISGTSPSITLTAFMSK